MEGNIFDRVSAQEAAYTKRCKDELSGNSYGLAMLEKLKRKSEIKHENRPYLFEIRLASEFVRRGFSFVYEHPATDSNKSVDFKVVINGITYLIELLSVRESQAATETKEESLKFLSRDDKPFFYGAIFNSDGDFRKSPAGELIQAQQKISSKNRKFSLPTIDTIHMVIADMRGCLSGMVEPPGYNQIAYGTSSVQAAEQLYSDLEKRMPILGIFDNANNKNGCKDLREKIHYIGFINEQLYEPNEIVSSALYICPNPHIPLHEQFLLELFR